ncbi:hypothetical protein [Thermoflexibacter ruber]|uniref:Uncharacterized protein n=1 Tax=Thermoflexibacter ruber TaxID=1003 RepID=A0A1I2DPX0_9BACT|nr:hypothetical protein [Thermoflexibacter ruber]SFE82323.1 hypothetical protein SAMN04488541_1007109 [Thermoflexibacter ruber]
MKKLDLILSDLEKLNHKESISLAQIDELIDSLSYTPLKQYLLCLKVGVKPDDATSILLKRLTEDFFGKMPLTEVRLKSSIAENAIQELVNQAVLLIAKPFYKVNKNEKGEVISLKAENLSIENYEQSIINYLSDNEVIIFTNFRKVFIFDKEAIEEFQAIQQLDFAQFLCLSAEKNSLAGLVQSWQKEYENTYISRQLDKTFKKFLQEESQSDLAQRFIFIKHLENCNLLPTHFLKNLYAANLQLWDTLGEEAVGKHFLQTINDFIASYYTFENEEFTTFQKSWTEQALGIQQNEKVKSLSDYNYLKINEYALGKAFENLYGMNNGFSEEVYDFFCENTLFYLFENQIDKILENIDKSNLKKAKQLFEEVQKNSIFNPFFESGIVLAKMLKLIFKQYQRIGNHIDKILDESTSLLDKDEHWKKLASFKEELGLNDLRKLIANIILHQLFISPLNQEPETAKQEQETINQKLLNTLKLNVYLSAIKLAPSAFHFKKLMPEEEKKALAKFGNNFVLPSYFSAVACLLPYEKWKDKTYKELISQYMAQVNENEFLTLFIPSQLLFNEVDTNLRQLLFIENSLLKVKLFEQEKTEWCFLQVQKKKPSKNHTFSFTLSNYESFSYKNELIAGFSPLSFHLIKFEQQIDYQICSKIKGQNPTLEEMGYTFKKEFKLSNDAHFFFRTQEEQTLPFCEGRMIEAYACEDTFKYFIPKEKAHTQLLSQEVNALKKRFNLSQKNYEIIGIFNEKGFLLDYESERLVIKLNATAQDRSMIAAILPAKVFAENNLLYLSNFSYSRGEKDLLQEFLNQEDLLFLLALFNSFAFNFYVQKIGLADLSLLPFPKLIHRKDKQTLKSQIIAKAFAILSNQNEGIFKDLGKKIGIESVPTITNPLYSDLRLDLESLIAKEVFELSEEEFEYVKENF